MGLGEQEAPKGSGMRRKEATLALQALVRGDPAQEPRLFELVYGELRHLAARCLADERRDHTLQPTALVHEVYLELIGPEGSASVKDRQHFLAIAAQAMRRALIDHARGKQREKRGGRRKRVDLDSNLAATGEELDLLELDCALDALRAHSAELSQLVELRFFAGLPMNEVAAVLGVSERTAVREWSFARAWLERWMREHGD